MRTAAVKSLRRHGYAQGLLANDLYGEFSPRRTPSKKSEEFKKQFLLGELLFLGGSKSSPQPQSRSLAHRKPGVKNG